MIQLSREHQFRLVLSWRKHARLVASRQQRPDAFSRRHLAAAEARLDRMRAEERARLDHLGTALQNALGQLQRMKTQPPTEHVNAGKLQRRAVELKQLIQEIRGGIAEGNRLVRAESPEELGDYIELPLEQYLAELEPARPVRPRRRWFGRSDRIAIAIGVALLLAGILGVLYFMRWRYDVSFAIRETPGGLVVTCVNHTHYPILWNVPWLEGATVRRPDRTYGLSLALYDPATDQFRMLPGATDAWILDGQPAAQRNTVTIESRMQSEARLQVNRLTLPGSPPFQLELQCSRGDGKVLLRHRLEVNNVSPALTPAL